MELKIFAVPPLPSPSALLGVSSKDCFIFLVRLITNYVLKDISAVTSLPRLSRTMSAANSSDQKVRHLIPNAACCVKFWSRVSGALFDVQCHSARISPGLKLVLVLACKFGTWQTLCFRFETWVRSYSIIWSWVYLVCTWCPGNVFCTRAIFKDIQIVDLTRKCTRSTLTRQKEGGRPRSDIRRKFPASRLV